MTVEAKIKQYLLNNNIQQKELSGLIHMPISKLNLTLNGKRSLKFNEYEAICGALHVGVDKFLQAKPPYK